MDYLDNLIILIKGLEIYELGKLLLIIIINILIVLYQKKLINLVLHLY